MRKEWLIIAVGIAAVSCGYNKFGSGTSSGNQCSEMPNAGIEVLREMYVGDKPYLVQHDIVIAGTVTANDSSGNFYQSIVIEDQEDAVELRGGFYDMNVYFPVGSRVSVQVKGMAVGCYEGVMQLGGSINDYSAYRVEGFGSWSIMSERVCRQNGTPPMPRTMEIGEMSADRCGLLVEVGKLLFARDTVVQWAAGNSLPSTSTRSIHYFTDHRGDSLAVVTSSYADFASDNVPTDSVSLTGILLHGRLGGGKERFGIKLRTAQDIRR